MEQQVIARELWQQYFVHRLNLMLKFIINQLIIIQNLQLRMRAKSAMVRKPATIEHDIEHQNQKSKILEEDRRLFLRQAEEIKEKYKEEIEKLKAENKKLKTIRDEFIASKKTKSQLSRTAYNTSFGSTTSKLALSNTDQNYLRIALDKEKHETKVKKSILFNLQDKLKEVEDNKLGYIEESPLMRNIRVLENRLDKVMIKYNEAQSVQQTYQEVVKRLKEERVGYDSQLASIENCLKGKEHDFEELLLLAHDATHAKEAAFAELKRFEQRRITVQQMRVKYVNEKKEEINKDIPPGNQSTTKQDKNNYIPKSNVVFNSYKHDENYQRQELNDYEEAFRKLKEVTGVIDANQIIQKFKTQGLTTNSLEELKESYKRKIEQLKEEKQNLRKTLQDNKFVKEKSGPERRRLDEIEQDSAKLTNQFQRTNIKNQKLSNSLINIKAGIEHLKELTSFYKKQGENTGAPSLQEDLKNLNEKLRRMYDVVKNDPNYMKYNYKASATAIQSLMNENAEYRNYNAQEQEEDDNSDDD